MSRPLLSTLRTATFLMLAIPGGTRTSSPEAFVMKRS